ncbi:unnamed protein product, partial [Pylaiella littoralis]
GSGSGSGSARLLVCVALGSVAAHQFCRSTKCRSKMKNRKRKGKECKYRLRSRSKKLWFTMCRPWTCGPRTTSPQQSLFNGLPIVLLTKCCLPPPRPSTYEFPTFNPHGCIRQ